MDVHIVSILGTLIALVAIASFETHAGNKGERGNLFRQRVLAYAILLLSSTATGIAWCKYPVYGAVHGLATYGAVAVILVERFSRYRIVQPLVVFTILLAFVLFIVMIPVVALPLFESPVLATVPQAPPAEDVDIAFLESSLSKIQGSLHVVRESIDTEAEKIEASISTLTAQLDQKRRELENLNSERARLSEEVEEVEQYKQLRSLEQEQIEAIKAQLERTKYVDYGVGFLIGLLANLLVSFLNGFIGSLNRQAANHTAGMVHEGS